MKNVIALCVGCLVSAFVSSWLTTKPLNKTIARQQTEIDSLNVRWTRVWMERWQETPLDFSKRNLLQAKANLYDSVYTYVFGKEELEREIKRMNEFIGDTLKHKPIKGGE